MDLQDFLNRVKILRSIDSDELVKAGLTHNQWLTFTADPAAFLIRQDDEVVSKVWAIVEGRAGRGRAALPGGADASILAAALASTRSLARAVANDPKARAATKEIAAITADQVDDALEALKRVEKGGA